MYDETCTFSANLDNPNPPLSYTGSSQERHSAVFRGDSAIPVCPVPVLCVSAW